MMKEHEDLKLEVMENHKSFQSSHDWFDKPDEQQGSSGPFEIDDTVSKNIIDLIETANTTQKLEAQITIKRNKKTRTDSSMLLHLYPYQRLGYFLLLLLSLLTVFVCGVLN